MANDVIFALAGSFLLGCLQPLVYGWVRKVLGKDTSPLSAFLALVLSLAVCSTGLIYLSIAIAGVAAFIAFGFMVGIGTMRALRKEI